jgi:hypothetical protein
MEMKNENQMQIELKEEIANGIYANLAVIAHSSSEFVMDFINMMPGVAKSQVRSRVIMAPEHVKRLAMALADNINRYEEQFGKIELHDRLSANSSKFRGEA